MAAYSFELYKKWPHKRVSDKNVNGCVTKDS